MAGNGGSLCATGPSPPSPAPFALLLPGRRIKARTCESRGTKGRHKGGWPCSALPVAPGPEWGPAGLASTPGMAGQPACPACLAQSAPGPRSWRGAGECPWGQGVPGRIRMMPLGLGDVPLGQNYIPGVRGRPIWSA